MYTFVQLMVNECRSATLEHTLRSDQEVYRQTHEEWQKYAYNERKLDSLGGVDPHWWLHKSLVGAIEPKGPPFNPNGAKGPPKEAVGRLCQE